MIQELTIACNQCNEEITCNYFDVIPLDKHNKDCLRKDELFTVTCPKCHNKTKLQYDCLCIDESNQYAIALHYDHNSKEEITRLLEDDEVFYQKRIVTDSFRLLEKVNIFDQHFDDRVIEIMKCFDILKIMKEFGTEKKIRDYFVQQENLRYFYVLIDDASYHLDFDQELYDQISNNMDFSSDSETLEIDYHWAIQKVTEIMK